MSGIVSRKGIVYLLGSLLVWFAVAVLLVLGPLGGGVRAYKLAMALFLTIAVYGLIVHFLIFQYARPKTFAAAVQTGIFVAFVTLFLYVLVGPFFGARVASALALKQIGQFLSFQFVLIFAALLLFLMQTIVGGGVAGVARWKSLDPAISHQIDGETPSSKALTPSPLNISQTMPSRMSRIDAAWAAGSLSAWLMLSLSFVIHNGASSFTHLKVWIALFVFAIQGVILHLWLFKRAQPKTLPQALRKGVLLALLALVVYAFPLFLIGWIAQGLGLRSIAALCSVQLMSMIEGLPLFLFQALLGGSIAGFARWKSLATNANASTGQGSPT
jgi:hypothetical protein